MGEYLTAHVAFQQEAEWRAEDYHRMRHAVGYDRLEKAHTALQGQLAVILKEKHEREVQIAHLEEQVGTAKKLSLAAGLFSAFAVFLTSMGVNLITGSNAGMQPAGVVMVVVGFVLEVGSLVLLALK